MSTYKNTIFLPKTKFETIKNIPEKEIKILKKWEDEEVYKKSIQCNKKTMFILHDGPPYANGHIHLGHVLNRVLKDFIIRSKNMMGFSTPFIPGWDCHGLPIEWKVEENYLKIGKNKKTIPIIKFREDCRKFANKWIKIQKKELQRLGLMADWDNPYTTMSKNNEAIIIKELSKFLNNGSLYKGIKPVLWSIVEETALAEAEVEYIYIESNSIYVKFPIIKSLNINLIGAKAIIWTTTPWTIPSNQAIAFNKNYIYIIAKITKSTKDFNKEDKILIAKNLLSLFKKNTNITINTIQEINGETLNGTIGIHPLYNQGYNKISQFLHSDHVNLSNGTGLVHIAPDHGPEDFDIGKINGLKILELVKTNGIFSSKTPIFTSMNIFTAEKLIIKSLEKSNNILAEKLINHSSLHSWRSKSPLIYRTTSQWFISMDFNNTREKAIKNLKNIQWYPTIGHQRLKTMIETRPDWCISRQRVWGVPLSLFINKKTGKVLKDNKIQNKIINAYQKHGSDIWFKDPLSFLKPEYPHNDYIPVMDTLDVWFESGCSFSYILENNPKLRSPADIYIEGSDQHRGWFQSSLIISSATKKPAPFKSIFTHGFILDEKGHKMSKSTNNNISPNNIIEKQGVEIIRLWVANSDVTEDLRFGYETIKHNQDIYRKLRNTFRYLLGGLNDFSNKELIDFNKMPELELWILSKLYSINDEIKNMYQYYNFQNLLQKIHNFCSTDLSSFYFNIRKDSLYCDSHNNLKRKATRTTFVYILEIITKWLAPILCFTTEEVWQLWKKNKTSSIHLTNFENIPNKWQNHSLEKKFKNIKNSLKLITGAIEEKRKNGLIFSSLQAQVLIFDPTEILYKNENWTEISMTSSVQIIKKIIPVNAFSLKDFPNLGVIIKKANGQKCQRCWKISQEVLSSNNKDLCKRCNEIINKT